MPLRPPQLPDTDWESYREFVACDYDYDSYSQHWFCPLCGGRTTVKKNSCRECGRERVKLCFKIGARGKLHFAWFMRQEKSDGTI